MDYSDLLDRSMDELRIKTDAHDRLWKLGDAAWSIDQDSETITFSAPNGMVATCPVQIIGTFNVEDSTWLWAWDHPSVAPRLQDHAKKLKEYGEANGIEQLTTRKLSIDEFSCWEFTALACHLNEGQGAYRCPTGSALVFVTFGDPQITSPDGPIETAQDETPPEAPVVDDFAGEFTTDIPDDIRTTMMGFITDMHDWEVEADKNSDDRDEIRNARAVLIEKWCVPNMKTQGLSYGSDPSHHPQREELVSVAANGPQCRVITKLSKSSGFNVDYEYHLRQIDGAWRIENFYYVDEDEKFPML
ncbi:DUF6882 domain-containing protein [Bremerella sp.]|uniref:DUF6882 domain-containing protein n=1 Tax=Bremerella sp. TaxID=2795602 RepID=UPI00391BE09E